MSEFIATDVTITFTMLAPANAGSPSVKGIADAVSLKDFAATLAAIGVVVTLPQISTTDRSVHA
jgi:hypothetical protein